MTDFGTRLEAFLEALPHDEGFVYGPRERLAVQQLMLELASQRALRARHRDLRGLIGPVLCGTPEQQRRFRALFDTAFPESEERPGSEDGEPAQFRSNADTGASRLARWGAVAAAIVVLALLLAGVALWQYVFTRPLLTDAELRPAPPANAPVASRSLTGKVEGDGAPLGDAEVLARGQKARTGAADGSFRLLVTRTDASPTAVLVSHPKFGERLGYLQDADESLITIRAPVAGQTGLQEAGKLLPLVLDGSPGQLRFSPDGRMLIIPEGTAGARLFNVPDVGSIHSSGVSFPVTPVAFANDSTVAGLKGDQLYLTRADGNVVSQTTTRSGTALDFRFRADLQQVGIQYASGWELEDLNSHTKLENLRWVDFARTGTKRLLITQTGEALVQDSAAATTVRRWAVQGNWVSGALLPDGHGVLLAADGTARLSSGESSLGRCEGASSITASPDGRWTAANGTNGVCLWDVTGAGRPTLLANSGRAKDLAFSPDSRWLMVRQASGGNAVYSARTGGVLGVPGTGVPTGASFTTDGHLLRASTETRHLSSDVPWWAAAIAAAVPMLALAAYGAWLYYRRARLRRYSAALELDTRQTGSPASEPAFRSPFVRRIGMEMRRRKPAVSQEIDIEPTLAASIACCGFLRPVYGTRTLQREFLVLIEKQSATDQQALLFQSLLQALREHVGLVNVYTFQGSPATVHDLETHAGVRLEELAALHPNHDLWLFAGPAILQDPFTLKPELWIADLSRWNTRWLFTPLALSLPLTVALQALGLRVSAASPDGIAALLDTMDSERAARLPDIPVYPAMLAHLPARWLDRASPPDTERAAMLSELRRYLGAEGSTLLAACAVYPELYWPLTLWFASQLCAAERRDAVLLGVTSLPWLRHGRMPDWLRTRLVSALSPAVDAQVRRVLDQFLLPRGEGHGLQFARPKPGASGEQEPEATSLKDYVMLEFLAGRTPDETLAVRPPSMLRRMLFERGFVSLAPRWRVMAGAAVLASVLVGGGTRWLAGAGGREVYVLTVTRHRLPGAATPVPVQRLELAGIASPRERTMVQVAASQMEPYLNSGSVSLGGGTSFVDAVVLTSTQIADGTEFLPQAKQESVLRPGLAFRSAGVEGFIESVDAGRRVMAIQRPAGGGPVTRIVAAAAPKGPYLDYSGGDAPAAVAASPVVVSDAAANGKVGYDPCFVTPNSRLCVEEPTYSPPPMRDPKINAANAETRGLDYLHFRVVMSVARKFALYAVSNVDGATLQRVSRGKDVWRYDPRLPRVGQVGEDVYTGNDLDRGHLVSRGEVAWGDAASASKAAQDVFVYTNAVPQPAKINQGVMAQIENFVTDIASKRKVRATVFTGPVLQRDDPVYRGVQIPQRFWKIAIFPMQPGTRDLSEDQPRPFIVPVNEIEKLTGLAFPSLKSLVDRKAVSVVAFVIDASEALRDAGVADTKEAAPYSNQPPQQQQMQQQQRGPTKK